MHVSRSDVLSDISCLTSGFCEIVEYVIREERCSWKLVDRKKGGILRMIDFDYYGIDVYFLFTILEPFIPYVLMLGLSERTKPYTC